MKIKLKLKEIIEYVILFLMIIQCNGIWLYLGKNSEINNIAVSSVIFILSIIYLVNNKNVNVIFKVLIFSTFFFMFLTIFYMLRTMNIIIIVRIYLALISAYILAKLNESNIISLLIKLRDVILFIAIVSLIMWLSCSVLNIIKPTSSLHSLWSNKSVNSYFGIYYNAKAYEFLGLNLPRNIAIFAEAPMTSFVFSIAFLITLFIQQNVGIKLGILGVAIFSTFSTTGLILVISSFALYFFINGKGNIYAKLVKYAIIPIILIAVVLVIGNLYQNKLSSDSGTVRLDDFVAGYKAWRNHIIFGNGIGNMDVIKAHMSSLRLGNIGFSNSLMSILSDGGLYLISPYAYAFLSSLIISIKSHNYNLLIFVLEFIFIFIITITHYTMMSMFMFMVLYLMDRRDIRKVKFKF